MAKLRGGNERTKPAIPVNTAGRRVMGFIENERVRGVAMGVRGNTFLGVIGS